MAQRKPFTFAAISKAAAAAASTTKTPAAAGVGARPAPAGEQREDPRKHRSRPKEAATYQRRRR